MSLQYLGIKRYIDGLTRDIAKDKKFVLSAMDSAFEDGEITREEKQFLIEYHNRKLLKLSTTIGY